MCVPRGDLALELLSPEDLALAGLAPEGDLAPEVVWASAETIAELRSRYADVVIHDVLWTDGPLTFETPFSSGFRRPFPDHEVVRPRPVTDRKSVDYAAAEAAPPP